ncbi:MAG TPA: hypothetical protein VK148_30070 [Xanthobacteraceae bacterium]|jgi:hypothetical protein|nr:hypothetical protein [Xanthobacteraceae bacterium]
MTETPKSHHRFPSRANCRHAPINGKNEQFVIGGQRRLTLVGGALTAREGDT